MSGAGGARPLPAPAHFPPAHFSTKAFSIT